MVGAGGELKAGYTIHKETDSSSVSLVGQRNSHIRHGRPRHRWQQFDTPCSLISALQWPIHPVVDRRGFAGSEKDHL